MSRRVLQLNRRLGKVLMEYFTRRMKGSFYGFISVKETALAADMKSAKVFLSLMSEQDLTKEACETLEKERFWIQKSVSKNLKMKFCPRLNFFVNHVPYTLTPDSSPPPPSE